MEKFGSHKSLLVPCVQELAKEKMVAIPPRYTRPDQETSIVSEVERGPQIPVIDMQNLLSAEAGDSELTKLHLACKEWGFFQLVNHGVSISLVEKVKLEIQEFFNLPMSEKKKFWQTSEDVEGFGQSFVVSESQKLDWGDIFFLTTLPTLVRKPHLFPKLPLPFRETLELYSLQLQNLALAVIELMGKALKMEAKEMMEFFEDGRQSMRMNYYPSCPQPNKVIGLTPHSDAVGLTILLQVNEVEGLQVKKDGIWVPVRPLSNAFILNIGDILEGRGQLQDQAMEKVHTSRFLLVPSVKELAQENITSVPPRYIRETIFFSETASLQEIPVVDMQSLLSQESQDSELAKLHLACKDWGFFQLVNHGISSTLLEKIKLETQEFFNLPMSEKKKFWQSSEDTDGFGQSFVVSEEQKLDWCDVFGLTTLPTHLRRPHLFPKLPLPFRDTLEHYSQQFNILARTLLGCMAKALKVEAKEIQELFEEGIQIVRVNYYPPCPEPDKVIGLTPHSDGSGLTIVLQVNEVEGLQIRKDGRWLPVKPLPNAFIVNIGDMLEVISNGIYRSIEHRAAVNFAKERLSIATFQLARYNGEIGPTPSLVNEQTPAQFKRIGVREFLDGLFARELDGKSYLNTLRIERSN